MPSFFSRVVDVPFFFFNDTATTEIYTLSLHDALPISRCTPTGRTRRRSATKWLARGATSRIKKPQSAGDRKSTRLNSSHRYISYAVFCLKKKKDLMQEGEFGSDPKTKLLQLVGLTCPH